MGTLTHTHTHTNSSQPSSHSISPKTINPFWAPPVLETTKSLNPSWFTLKYSFLTQHISSPTRLSYPLPQDCLIFFSELYVMVGDASIADIRHVWQCLEWLDSLFQRPSTNLMLIVALGLSGSRFSFNYPSICVTQTFLYCEMPHTFISKECRHCECPTQGITSCNARKLNFLLVLRVVN